MPACPACRCGNWCGGAGRQGSERRRARAQRQRRRRNERSEDEIVCYCAGWAVGAGRAGDVSSLPRRRSRFANALRSPSNSGASCGRGDNEWPRGAQERATRGAGGGADQGGESIARASQPPSRAELSRIETTAGGLAGGRPRTHEARVESQSPSQPGEPAKPKGEATLSPVGTQQQHRLRHLRPLPKPWINGPSRHHVIRSLIFRRRSRAGHAGGRVLSFRRVWRDG